MKKIGLLTTLVGMMSIGTGALLAQNNVQYPERDTKLIIEVNQSLTDLTEKQIRASQDLVFNNIYYGVTKNVRMNGRYTVLNNAFIISCNSNDVESIKNVPGVKSVTEDKIHWKKVINNDETYSVTLPSRSGDTMIPNVSASTMGKPDETYDGEGTVIAVLDNEFYFRGTHTASGNDDGASWHHETYADLDANVTTKFTFDNLTTVLKRTNAKRQANKTAGQEGSLYFNKKIPFYYDYGGSTPTYGSSNIIEDYDVHSEIDYHGSHVSSIAAGNAPTYKGIAPKAQLACMKVFTEYKADQIGEGLGFSSHSGAYDSVILKALEDCITLGVDGINMSLGSDLDDFDQDSITLKTLTKLAGEKGILTSISAGNSGKTSFSFAGGYGNWTNNMVETGILSSYANNKAVMTIASGQPDRIFYENALVINGKNIAYNDQVVNREGLPDDFEEEHKLEELLKTPDQELEYIYTGKFGSASDYAKIDVSGKIAIVNRGSTSFEDKYNQAKSFGAIGLIIINNDPTSNDFNFRCSFGETEPEIPVSLLLFKDKVYFDQHPEGKFNLIAKQESENETPRTISTFSSDGAAFDFDLKPEITAPGDSIRGAVPPQTKEDKADTPLNTYQYLSGTSMSAPNFAGAQSVMLSNATHDVYADGTLSSSEKTAVDNYRKTINMRLMSTTVPMFDSNVCPEENTQYVDNEKKVNYTSPRLQGAGMVNLGGAMATDVYLEGLDITGNRTGKAKIALHNNADIAKGNVKLSFISHNESNESRTYNAKLTVMRPAVALNNDIVTKDYNFKGQVEDPKLIPGISYWNGNSQYTDTGASNRDVINVSKHVEFWLTKADWDLDHDDMEEHAIKEHSVVLEIGNYYYDANCTDTFKWKPLPSKEYQSVQDTLIAEVNMGTITVAPGEQTVNLQSWAIPTAERELILSKFPYGCAIEGYVTLESTQDKPDLNIPYLGFYSGADVDESKTLEKAPVVEEFAFEKDPGTVYPSDLANDIAKTLVGKDNADMGSMWVAGYASSVDAINTDKILENDLAYDDLLGFYNVGINPLTGEYFDNPGSNIYVGDAYKSNTMIIQQFVLRSVADNYFTITRKADNKAVYTSCLEDCLFGEQRGKYPLYKSHVEASYLSAGYVAHRAQTIIPLYDVLTGEKFASGEYEIKFNYLLSGTGTWVSKAYDFHIVSETPAVSEIERYTENGEKMMRFVLEGEAINYAVVGYDITPVTVHEGKKVIEMSLDDVKDKIAEISEGANPKRLYIKVVNNALGVVGAIIQFTDKNYEDYRIAQSSEFTVNNNFRYNAETKTVQYVVYDEIGDSMPYNPTTEVKTNLELASAEVATGGCGGSAVTSSIIVTVIALITAGSLIAVKTLKRKENN